LNVGTEEHTVRTELKEAHELIEAQQKTAEFNFVGFVEGGDIPGDVADVIVTDGFTGNVVLKTLEGAMRTVLGELRRAITADPAMLEHAVGLEPVLTPLVESLEAETYGGAMLLGTDGVCIISHGSSSPTAIANAIDVAADMVRSDVVGSIAAAIRPEPA